MKLDGAVREKCYLLDSRPLPTIRTAGHEKGRPPVLGQASFGVITATRERAYRMMRSGVSQWLATFIVVDPTIVAVTGP